MGTYCEPIRFADWCKPEPRSYWYEEEKTEDDDIYFGLKENFDRYVRESYICRDSQIAELFITGSISIAQSAEAEGILGKRFQEYAEKWTRETAHLSSITKRIAHISYLNIIAMGPDAVPLLLRDLQRNGRLWFWALNAITHENPVDPRDAGDVMKMTEAWIRWGIESGKL